MLIGQRAGCFRLFWIAFVFVISGMLAGCGSQARDANQSGSFIPPTAESEVSSPLLVPATHVATVPSRELRPTPTPACTNILSFLEDVTIPDGTAFQPGEVMDKRWQVENSGTCNWDDRYRLKQVSGPALGAEPEQALYPARSGAQIALRIVFVAPPELGTYRSAWQAYDPEGLPFGDQFYIEVIVQAQAP